MAIHNLPEERQVIKLLEKLAFVETDRKVWIEEIQATGLTEELAEQIHQKLAAPVDGESQALVQAKSLVEFSQLVRRWRMARGAKKFH